VLGRGCGSPTRSELGMAARFQAKKLRPRWPGGEGDGFSILGEVVESKNKNGEEKEYPDKA